MTKNILNSKKYNVLIKIFLILFCLSFFSITFCVCGESKIDSVCANDNSSQIQFENAKKLINVQLVNDYIYALDCENEKVYQYNVKDKKIATFGGKYKAESPETTFVDLINYCVVDNQKMFITESQTGIKEYSIENGVFTFIKRHEIVLDSNNNAINIQYISDIYCDMQNNIYALEYGEQTQIYKKSQTDNEFMVYKTLNLKTTAKSRIISSFDSSKFYILDNGMLWQLENETFKKVLDLSMQEKIMDCNVDYQNNVYVLLENTRESKIQSYKFNASSNLYELQNEKVLAKNYTSFDFDYEVGTLYLAINSVIDVIDNSDNFINCLNTYVHSVDYQKNEALTSACEIGVLKNDSNIYKQPIEIINLATMNKNTHFIILNDNILEYPNFTYGLFTLSNGSIRHLVGAYVLKANYEVKNFEITPPFNQALAINNNTKIYKYPTTNSFLEVKNGSVESLDLKQLVLDTFSQNAIITIKTSCNLSEFGGLDFYEIDYKGEIAYVLQSAVCENNTKNIAFVNAPNAQIILPKGMQTAKIYSDCYKTHLIAEIECDKLVFALEDSVKNDFIKIQYLNADNEIVSGYIESNYLKNIGISIYVIMGVGVLFLALIITLVIIYCNVKKNKKDSAVVK